MQEVLNEVRLRSFPTDSEKKNTLDLSSELMEIVKSNIKGTPGAEGVTPLLVGSVAKMTFLKEVDIDLFLRFPTGTDFDTIERLGLAIARKVLPDGIEKYAQHPYIMGYFKGLETDIVPCIEIRPGDQVVSAVDRTPLHCEYVIASLDEIKREDVMLLKAFTKGIGVYGANEEFQGLSGYLCELLVILYGGFEKVITAAENWEEGERFTIAGTEDGGLKYNSPLTFIDPTDSKRNVAQAVSKESLALFKRACSEFLKEPDITFVYPNEPGVLDEPEVEGFLKNRTVFGIKLTPPPELLRDHLFGQFRKTTRSLATVFERCDIPIEQANFFIFDSAYILLSYEKDAFQRVIDHQGPKAKDIVNAQNFKDKWKSDPRAVGEPFTKNGTLYIKRKPIYPEPELLLEKSFESISWGRDIKSLASDAVTAENLGLLDWEEKKVISRFIADKDPWHY